MLSKEMWQAPFPREIIVICYKVYYIVTFSLDHPRCVRAAFKRHEHRVDILHTFGARSLK